MDESAIRTVGVLGAGVMGSGIAMSCAQAGYDVVLRDIEPAALERARDTMRQGRFGWQRAIELGKLTGEAVQQAESRLALVTEARSLAAVDLLIEAIPEDEDLKKQVLAEFDAIVQPGAIFATNTSGIAIASLCQAVRRRDRFLGMHWFSPANIMPLVELVHTPDTSEETIGALEDASRRMGKHPIRVRDAPGSYGFVANRVFYAAIAEARRIAEAGIATEEDIDLAMRLGYNWPAGPFETLHGRVTGWE